MRRFPLLVLGIGVVIAVAGCTSSVPGIVSSPHAAAVRAVPVPDGVVGTGTLSSWNGRTGGSLQVLAHSGHFTFVLSDFSTDFTGENLFALSDAPVTMSQCGENNLWQTGLGSSMHTVGRTQRFTLPNVLGAWGDPSFFQTFLFMQYPTGQVTRGCQQPIVALAKIHWTIPTIYPGLVVHDGGPAAAAQGTVKTVDGALFSYKTSQGDTWAAIAHRFGITPAELIYLNPIRHPDAEPAIAYADQVLNLTVTNRGNSESRRP